MYVTYNIMCNGFGFLGYRLGYRLSTAVVVVDPLHFSFFPGVKALSIVDLLLLYALFT